MRAPKKQQLIILAILLLFYFFLVIATYLFVPLAQISLPAATITPLSARRRVARLVYRTAAGGYSARGDPDSSRPDHLYSLMRLIAGQRAMHGGLVAAMGVHFWADVVWHVIWPLLGI